MIVDAIASRSCFNVIQLATMFKVDVFVFDGSAMQAEELARREAHVIEPETGRRLVFASAEDTILQKLRWFDQGGRSSDRQWRDALGVVQVRGVKLDRAYLRRWAPALGVEELLEGLLAAGSTSMDDTPA